MCGQNAIFVLFLGSKVLQDSEMVPNTQQVT